MISPLTLLTLLLSLPCSWAFIGLGISMYHPSCAFACRAAVVSAPLECSDHGGSGGHMGHGSSSTTPECRAGDTPFLTTLAWCINSTCTDFHVDAWRLEKYWTEKATGDVDVLPKWTYAGALQQVQSPPATELDPEEILNSTAIVPPDSWQAEKNSMEYFEKQETWHARYGLVLLVTGCAAPILATLLCLAPCTTHLVDAFKPYLVYPSLIGNYQVEPLPYLLGNAPTMGQALFVIIFAILNVVLAAVSYPSTQPNTWFEDTYQEIMAYVANRTGVLAFAVLPLVILFAGRNNILLWLTNWSHSTYMLLHRWVARIFAVQVIVHSIVELVLYKNMGSYEEELVQPYWIWGIVATVATCIMLLASVLFLRRRSYELFLILHILLAVFVIVGCWYHVEFLFQRKWGYEYWLYAACAVWFTDRLLRVLRVAQTGLLRASVTDISELIVRVDIEGVNWSASSFRKNTHAYAYFPTLNPFRPWENHPFSVIPTALLHPPRTHTPTNTRSATPSTHSISSPDPEKSAAATTTTITKPDPASLKRPSMTLYIRKSPNRGLTSLLHPMRSPSLPSLLDGPYASTASPSPAHRPDRLLLLAGGIGITGVLPSLIYAHDPLHSSTTSVALHWSLKTRDEALVGDLMPLLEDVQSGGARGCGGAEGGKAKMVWDLEVDAFSW
ncbi:Flavoprotein transmembrane component [Macrophomina phaseolina MS6]|uniref:Flavoprotein transmembrane component n=1 Tax=Macrophomina phaseolina (strain MS6) TaxID=1126212 RepID=K2SI59_MACPH|nr:Flavoprotein transmembrane component [Macrophomina phaseolina MS6]